MSKYSIEKNVQILISLLKQYGIKRIIASPGTANMSFVASMQIDSFFEIYSSVDERSAAYMACGMAAETGQPVVITCTEATASRNYMPGLTEAYYRKLPVLAVMTSHGDFLVGSYEPQCIDNRVVPNDIVKFDTHIHQCKDKQDERTITVRINEALNQLFTYGGGPVRILLESRNPGNLSVEQLPHAKIIKQVNKPNDLPELPKGDIAIFVGSHLQWNSEEVAIVEKFCESNNSVVLCDLTSNYPGKYRINFSLIATQEGFVDMVRNPKLIIYIGCVTGDYYTSDFCRLAEKTWFVSKDGRYRDRFNNLDLVATMEESEFFSQYLCESHETSYHNELKALYEKVFCAIPELPLSNLWIAQQSSRIVPQNCEIHAAINNSLRSWNYFELPHNVIGSCNVGGYGIDGGMSTMIGASTVSPHKLFFCIIGDLAFFYDVNVIGNRHVGNNVRILLINNGVGQEFRNYQHPAFKLGKEANKYIAASGHFGNKSLSLVKGMAESFGYKYMKAESKEEFLSCYEDFFSDKVSDKPILFEVFTNSDDENKALDTLRHLYPKIETTKDKIKSAAKDTIKTIVKKTLTEDDISKIKSLLH